MAIKYVKSCQYVVRCDMCTAVDHIDDIDADYRLDDTPSRYFRRQGWRNVNGINFCPNCAKQLKSQRK